MRTRAHLFCDVFICVFYSFFSHVSFFVFFFLFHKHWDLQFSSTAFSTLPVSVRPCSQLAFGMGFPVRLWKATPLFLDGGTMPRHMCDSRRITTQGTVIPDGSVTLFHHLHCPSSTGALRKAFYGWEWGGGWGPLPQIHRRATEVQPPVSLCKTKLLPFITKRFDVYFQKVKISKS